MGDGGHRRRPRQKKILFTTRAAHVQMLDTATLVDTLAWAGTIATRMLGPVAFALGVAASEIWLASSLSAGGRGRDRSSVCLWPYTRTAARVAG